MYGDAASSINKQLSDRKVAVIATVIYVARVPKKGSSENCLNVDIPKGDG